MHKYRVTCITIKGKGNTKVDQWTNSLRAFRQEVARNNNVTVGMVSLTYDERELCVQ